MPLDGREEGQPAPPDTPALACLSGGRPDPKLLRDWRAYQTMDARLRPVLLDLLQQVYRVPLGRELAERVGAFAQQAALAPMTAQSILECLRFLFSHAVRGAIEPEAFAKDLHALSGGVDEGIDDFVAHYGSYGPLRRQEYIREALLDHGRLLTGVEWRLDVARRTGRTSRIELPVVMLGLKYAEGSGTSGKNGSISLQIPAGELGALRRVLDEIEATLAAELGMGQREEAEP